MLPLGGNRQRQVVVTLSVTMRGLASVSPTLRNHGGLEDNYILIQLDSKTWYCTGRIYCCIEHLFSFFLLSVYIRFDTRLVQNQKQCSSVTHSQTEQTGIRSVERSSFICVCV